MLCWGPEKVTKSDARQTVELGTVHCIPYSDNAMIPTCHRIPRYLEEDIEENVRMVGRAAWDAGRKYTLDMRAVPHCFL